MKLKPLFLTLLLTALSAFSTEYFVDASRPDDLGAATNWATAKQTIQAAVDLTVDGDTVWVTNGTYAHIVVTNSITIHSKKGPEETIINGNGARCVKLASESILDGFTVTNGYAGGGSVWQDGEGGGIYCDYPSTNTVITNCVIIGNRAKNNAAGVSGGFLNNCVIKNNTSDNTCGGVSGAVLSECVVSDNHSGWIGGGVYYCQVSDCLISNNYSAGWGAGGIYKSTVNNSIVIGNHTDATGGGARECTLNNCLVAGNQAEFGGGVSQCTLINCTVTKNVATNSTGDSCGGGAAYAILRNCIVFNNSAVEGADYYYTDQNDFWVFDAQCSCFSEATAGLNGNINSDPKFVNASAGNYRLQSTSPCVNAGINADASGSVDLDGNNRIVHTYVDMGAYESGYASPKQYIRDFLPTNGTVFSVTNTVYLSATGGESGNPVTFTNLPGCPVVWINSTTMQFAAGGDIYITANQKGTLYYAAAEPVTNHYVVPYTGVFYVDASRPDDTGDGTTWLTAKQTIQVAVNLAAGGSTIWVTNGTYVLSAEILITNAITVRSVNGPETTIIDGCGSNRCFNLSGECLISGFTVTKGFTSGEYTYVAGGGIYCLSSQSIVSNCIITGNRVGGYEWSSGGGMNDGTAINCIFSNNAALSAGGMNGGVASNCVFVGNSADGSGPLMGNIGSFGGGGMSYGAAYSCTFSNNSANWSGGGMEGGQAYNCVFKNNRAGYCGGGISSAEAFGCLFHANDAYAGGGVYYGTVYNCTIVSNSSGGISGDSEARNTIVWGNVDDESGYWGSFLALNCCSPSLIHCVNGNITNAPLFVDAASGNFRLQSNSPCINWGNNAYVTNSTDLIGNPRIVEGTVDMGAYEYQGTVGLADSDNDGINDDWERAHGGNQNPDNTCSNGVNTILQAYVAGLDPNDPDSKLLTSFLRSPTSGNELQWQGVSGRVYAVYYSTNLISGFQPLEINIPWSAGCFTDSVHHAHGQLFYKLDVRFDNSAESGGGGVEPDNPFNPGGGSGGGDTPATPI